VEFRVTSGCTVRPRQSEVSGREPDVTTGADPFDGVDGVCGEEL
jgi:hypothetical protein